MPGRREGVRILVPYKLVRRDSGKNTVIRSTGRRGGNAPAFRRSLLARGATDGAPGSASPPRGDLPAGGGQAAPCRTLRGWGGGAEVPSRRPRTGPAPRGHRTDDPRTSTSWRGTPTSPDLGEQNAELPPPTEVGDRQAGVPQRGISGRSRVAMSAEYTRLEGNQKTSCASAGSDVRDATGTPSRLSHPVVKPSPTFPCRRPQPAAGKLALVAPLAAAASRRGDA